MEELEFTFLIEAYERAIEWDLDDIFIVLLKEAIILRQQEVVHTHSFRTM
ncbi:sporulation histidine kinase inhibitor Sda [Alkalihalobacillus hemicellulosilyticus]|nr:sporulation histidine kinase inhibitor Sda [Halalkalibacter hemicellulosilyticus]